jgi:hypothetical protein
MQRILDIDLDFFVHGAAHWVAYDGDRLDADEFPPWPLDDAIAFLRRECGLTRRLPGLVVERHGELFDRWRDAIAAGHLAPPLSVTHVDAHADLGMGDAGYVHLMSELLFEPVEQRRFPKTGDSGMDDGNWVSFAVACGWVGELIYVFNTTDSRPEDILSYVMEGFDPSAAHIRLAAVNKRDINDLWMLDNKTKVVQHYEPRVPFRTVSFRDFRADRPFDVICLTRSAAFTPAASDALFDEIRDRFIDEVALSDV